MIDRNLYIKSQTFASIQNNICNFQVYKIDNLIHHMIHNIKWDLHNRGIYLLYMLDIYIHKPNNCHWLKHIFYLLLIIELLCAYFTNNIISCTVLNTNIAIRWTFFTFTINSQSITRNARCTIAISHTI